MSCCHDVSWRQTLCGQGSDRDRWGRGCRQGSVRRARNRPGNGCKAKMSMRGHRRGPGRRARHGFRNGRRAKTPWGRRRAIATAETAQSAAGGGCESLTGRARRRAGEWGGGSGEESSRGGGR